MRAHRFFVAEKTKKFEEKIRKLIKKKRPLSWRLYSIGGEGGKHSEKTSSAPIPPLFPPQLDTSSWPPAQAHSDCCCCCFSIVHIFFTPKRKSAVAIELFYCKECTLSIVAVVVVSNSGIHRLSNRYYSTRLLFCTFVVVVVVSRCVYKAASCKISNNSLVDFCFLDREFTCWRVLHRHHATTDFFLGYFGRSHLCFLFDLLSTSRRFRLHPAASSNVSFEKNGIISFSYWFCLIISNWKMRSFRLSNSLVADGTEQFDATIPVEKVVETTKTNETVSSPNSLINGNYILILITGFSTWK